MYPPSEESLVDKVRIIGMVIGSTEKGPEGRSWGII